MNIADLTDTQLSEWIAMKLEPALMMPDRYLYVGPSELGTRCHITAFDIAEDGDTLVNIRWQPRDMVGDPAMTVMLLERMGLIVIARQFNVGWRVVLENGRTVDNRALGRAVAEGYALANGWTE